MEGSRGTGKGRIDAYAWIQWMKHCVLTRYPDDLQRLLKDDGRNFLLTNEARNKGRVIYRGSRFKLTKDPR
jgi:hypothetical protein